MGSFIALCVAQAISVAGSQITAFALGLWLYEKTGSVQAYATLGLATMLPTILAAPLAGVLVDRFHRRNVLLFGTCAGGLTSLAIALAFHFGALSPFLALALVVTASLATAASGPALAATTALLVPRHNLARANGLFQLVTGVGQIAAPAIAGSLRAYWGFDRIVLLDVASFGPALAMLLLVRIPTPRVDGDPKPRQSLYHGLTYGFVYVRRNHGLRSLLMFFAFINLNMTIVNVLLPPLVLGFADARALGLVLSTAGVGMLLGSAAVTLAPPPMRAIHGVLGFSLVQSAMLVLGATRPAMSTVCAGTFGFAFAFPFIAANSQAIWQRVVPVDVQGRVFAFRMLFAQITVPIGFALAGPLADRVFTPAMRSASPVAAIAGRWLGTGPGRGLALLFVVLAACCVGAVLVAYSNRALREVDGAGRPPADRAGGLTPAILPGEPLP